MYRFIPLAAFAVAITAFAHAAEPVTGQWLTAKGNAVVTIRPCGAAICGRISRIVSTPADNPHALDSKNAKPELRGRKLLGLPIIPAFTDVGGHWHGSIYDPQTGRDYDGYLSKNADGTLSVKGCLAPLLCQTQLWKPFK